MHLSCIFLYKFFLVVIITQRRGKDILMVWWQRTVACIYSTVGFCLLLLLLFQNKSFSSLPLPNITFRLRTGYVYHVSLFAAFQTWSRNPFSIAYIIQLAPSIHIQWNIYRFDVRRRSRMREPGWIVGGSDRLLKRSCRINFLPFTIKLMPSIVTLLSPVGVVL